MFDDYNEKDFDCNVTYLIERIKFILGQTFYLKSYLNIFILAYKTGLSIIIMGNDLEHSVYSLYTLLTRL